MKRTRTKLLSLFFLLLLAACISIPVLRTYRDIQQQQLDRALIAAIKKQDNVDNVKKQDTREILALLNAGANPNARDIPRDTRPFWRQMWDRMRGKKPTVVAANAPTALWVHLQMIFVQYEIQSTSDEGLLQRRINENAPLLQALLQHGADRNLPDADGTPPLFAALSCHCPASARLLWSPNVNVQYRAKDGTSLLMQAALDNMPDLVQKLLAQGVDVNAVTQYGQTALMLTDDPAIAGMLLDKGANLDAKDDSGDTALHIHSWDAKQFGVAKLLIRCGVNKNAQNQNGETALMYAYLHHNAELARFLIEQGANARIRDKQGRTAREYKEYKATKVLIFHPIIHVRQ